MIRAFQRANGLSEDGIAGPVTRRGWIIKTRPAIQRGTWVDLPVPVGAVSTTGRWASASSSSRRMASTGRDTLMERSQPRSQV